MNLIAEFGNSFSGFSADKSVPSNFHNLPESVLWPKSFFLANRNKGLYQSHGSRVCFANYEINARLVIMDVWHLANCVNRH